MPLLEHYKAHAVRRRSNQRRLFLTKYGRVLHFESLEDRQLLALTGDAPPPYPAASVSEETGPILGATRDADDGVVFDELLVGQPNVAVSITVTSAMSGTVIDGWIDFNRDGSFGGAFEQVFDSVTLSNGTTDLPFDVPSWADDGRTYARFRISRGVPAGLSQGGIAANGEVEDHEVFIHRPFVGSGNFGTERNITSNGTANGVVDVLTVDLDRDGDIDVVSSSHIDGLITFWRNTNNGSSWSRTVVGNVAPSNSGNLHAVGLAAGDLDGDGDIDLVSASEFDDTVAWYRNNGSSFTKFTVNTVADGARAVVVADFDRDGRLDLASVSLRDNAIRIHQNTGSANSSQLFNSAVAVAFQPGSSPADIYACDIDRDGWEDIVSITSATNRVAWHPNDGSPFTDPWGEGTEIFDTVDSETPGGSGVFAGDIDGERDLDVVATFFNQDRVDWFRNSNGGSSWSRLAVGGSIDGANPPFVADIDGDGDMDVLTPAYLSDTVFFHRNNGAGTFALGDSVPFGTGANVSVADINGDGVLDIVAGGDDNDRISWWENPRLLPEIVVTGEGLEIGDGDSSPRPNDGTNFGNVARGGAPISKSFVIQNTGEGTLVIGLPTVPTGFMLTAGPEPYLWPGESTEFTVSLETAIAGTKVGQISFANNDPNENPFNFTITGRVTSPEVAVSGNNNNIVDGDSTPSDKEGTVFGTVAQGGSPVIKMFTVRNDGDATLTLGDPTVPDGYTVNGLVSSLAPGASDTFTVVLETATPGTKTGQISFSNNDSDENPFNFTITGKVTATPEVAVSGNGIDILDGDSSPRPEDGTVFGTVAQGGSPVIKMFTVRNDGDATLTLSPPTVPDGYTLTDGLSSSLTPGASDTFAVRLDTAASGTKSGQISFTNNDSDENPFNFTITGKVTATPEVAVSGNGIDILDGDSSPRPEDGTDFGTVVRGGSPVSKMFTVRNEGDATLTLGAPTFPAGFTVNGLNSSLAPGASDSFMVVLQTATTGTKTGQISFTNNDSDENPFNFTIIGIVIDSLPGDYNKDRVVDSLDYQVWRASFGASGSNLAADGNGNNVVDAADYVVWRNNLGARLSPGLTNLIDDTGVSLSSHGSGRTTGKWIRQALPDNERNNLFLLVGRVRSERQPTSDAKLDDSQRARASAEVVESTDAVFAALGHDEGEAWNIL
jgi:hypothetical protein